MKNLFFKLAPPAVLAAMVGIDVAYMLRNDNDMRSLHTLYACTSTAECSDAECTAKKLKAEARSKKKIMHGTEYESRVALRLTKIRFSPNLNIKAAAKLEGNIYRSKAEVEAKLGATADFDWEDAPQFRKRCVDSEEYYCCPGSCDEGKYSKDWSKWIGTTRENLPMDGYINACCSDGIRRS